MAIHNESELETYICEYLEQHDWLYSPNDAGYDRKNAIFPEDVHAWLAENQPEDYGRIVKADAPASAQQAQRDQITTRLIDVLNKPQDTGVGGTLNVLRKGFKVGTSATLRMAEPRPATNLNPAAVASYERMRLRVMRQVHFTGAHESESVDLVLFVNGLPVATIELKTDSTQSIGHAKKQYRERNPKATPLFGFGTRAVVHFAVSNREVWMTTKLAGKDTFFLPFNQGDDGHAGNPLNPNGGSSTAYLWERILQRDTWLEILQKFVFLKKETVEDEYGRSRRKSTLIFPRFHQWEAVTTMLAAVREEGAGASYLIEHSAGSGKTNTIAWTAHRLLSTYGADEQRVFDSVIVVTDRTVLDDQLQEAVRQIERTSGTVVAVDRKNLGGEAASKSALVKQTLLQGNRIIVVTLQTFPAVLELLKGDSTLAGRTYAVIADEAHSSQTGSAAAKLKRVLTPDEQADLEDGGEADTESILAAEVAATGRPENISFFAFTATPKDKTLQMFGRPSGEYDEKGQEIPASFHRYTMQQAIEEEFILDVLKNFTNYDTAFKLALAGQQGEFRPDGDRAAVGKPTTEVDQTEASKKLMRWVKLHPTNIAQKVKIIVEHFRANVAGLLDGQAKAMVVTDSRAAAVRYKRQMDQYIQDMGYTDVDTLVAFSGEITDDEFGLEKVTERSMNPSVTGDLAKAFDGDGYQVMIVANKYQTGFDQPKLCALYVDKKLSGVLAVQTLSRLNRAAPGKDTTYVLDFVNSEDDIQAAFEPYYAGAKLETVTDPNLIHDLGTKLDAAGVYDWDEVDAFAEVWVAWKPGSGQEGLQAALEPVAYRFRKELAHARMNQDESRVTELVLTRKDMRSFVSLYDFLSQIYEFGDTEHYKRALFLRHLVQLVGDQPGGEELIDLSDVQLVSIRQTKTSSGDIGLTGGAALKGTTAVGGGQAREKQRGPLEEVIEKINEIFAGEGVDASPSQQEAWVSALVAPLMEDEKLLGQAGANSLEQFLASPNLERSAMGAVYANEDTFAKMTDIVGRGGDPSKMIVAAIGEYLYWKVRSEGAGPVDVAHGRSAVFADETAPSQGTSVDERASATPSRVRKGS